MPMFIAPQSGLFVMGFAQWSCMGYYFRPRFSKLYLCMLIYLSMDAAVKTERCWVWENTLAIFEIQTWLPGSIMVKNHHITIGPRRYHNQHIVKISWKPLYTLFRIVIKHGFRKEKKSTYTLRVQPNIFEMFQCLLCLRPALKMFW